MSSTSFDAIWATVDAHFARFAEPSQCAQPTRHERLVHTLIVKRNIIWYAAQEGVMPYQATAVVIAAVDRPMLEHWSRRGRTEQRLAERAHIVLRAAEGHGTPVTR